MSRRSHGHDSADPAPLALAVIGCGAVVEGLYLAPLRTLESRGIARVAALVDPDPARTAALARHFPSARTFARPAEALAQLESRNVGKPIASARDEALGVSLVFDYYAGAANKVFGEPSRPAATSCARSRWPSGSTTPSAW